MVDNHSSNKTIEELAKIGSVGSMIAQRWIATILDFGILVVLFYAIWFLRGEIDTRLWISGVIIYYLVFESYGFTIGKLVAGLRIVDVNGEHPGFLKAVLRTLLRIIEVNPILLGGLPAAAAIFFSSGRQRIGDMLARTYVVRVSHLNELRSRKGEAP